MQIKKETDSEIVLVARDRQKRVIAFNCPPGFLTVTDYSFEKDAVASVKQLPLEWTDTPSWETRTADQLQPGFLGMDLVRRTYLFGHLSMGGFELWSGQDAGVCATIEVKIEEAGRKDVERVGIGRMESARDVEGLISTLTSPNAFVRAAAAAALGRLGGTQAVEGLTVALNDHCWHVRLVAAQALGQTRDPRALEPLLGALDDLDAGSAACTALAGIISPEGLARALRHANPRVRSHAAELLANNFDPQAISPLIQANLESLLGALPGVMEVRPDTRAALAKVMSFEGLMRSLRHADPMVRENGAELLYKRVDQRTTPPFTQTDLDLLLEKVSDPIHRVRWVATSLLLAARYPPLEQALVDELHGRYPENQAEAADWLWRLNKDSPAFKDPETLITLLATLDKVHEGIRTELVKQLTERRDVTRLISALRHPELGVRAWAANVLGGIGDPAAIAGLGDALRDPHPDMRLVAVRALAKIQDNRAVDPLCVALKDANSVVRLEATQAIAKFKDNMAVYPLFEASKDVDHSVSFMAVSALGSFPSAVEELIRVLQDGLSDVVRVTAATSLGNIGDPQALPALKRACRDQDKGVRANAELAIDKILEGLGESKDPKAVDLLITALEDRDSGYGARNAAAMALGKIGDARALPALKRACRDREKNVRYSAKEAIDKISRQKQ